MRRERGIWEAMNHGVHMVLLGVLVTGALGFLAIWAANQPDYHHEQHTGVSRRDQPHAPGHLRRHSA